MHGSRQFRRRFCAALARSSLIAAFSAVPVIALAAAADTIFDIKAGPLDRALLDYAAQTHQQLIYDSAIVRGLRSLSLQGRFTAEAGLDRLLAGSDIVATRSRPGVIVLKLKPRASPSKVEKTPASRATSTPDTPASAVLAPSTTADAASAGPTATQLDAVLVTGSLIRGRLASPSPMVVVSRDELDKSGEATIADLLARLPQNFGGAASPDTALIGSDGRSTNDTMSKGVNLRGLGATATLVLVNGRRMAGTGLKGDFADVSAIPTATIERVEVLLDGASAIYGSDAVGGVVNIILRQNFDGAESRARLGQAAGGTAGQIQLAHTMGHTWADGHALIAFEFQHDEPLAAADRRYTATTDLRFLGGSDHRLIYSHPGNILVFNPAVGGFVAGWAIPPGQDGSALTPGDFIAGVGNLEDYRRGAEIQPGQDRHSLYIDLQQALTSRVDIGVEARLSRRSFNYALPASTSIFSVSAANPHFVSPNASRSELIGYAFGDELGPIRSRGTSQSLGATAELDIELTRSWRAEIYGAYAQERGRRRSDNELNSGALNEALGNTADNPATAFSVASDGYFNPFGDGGANSSALLAFIGSGYEASWSTSQVATFNAKADGDLFALPGGVLKAALGVQLRQERFTPRAEALSSGVRPITTGGLAFERNISAAFLELRAPLFGPANARAGLERLELSLAGRVECYADVGTTTNPKLGLLWTPVGGLNIRSTYGTSFRAPALTEVFGLEAIAPTFLKNGASQALVLLQYGGNRELKPETARSWTIGADIHPPAVPGLTINATWFDIRFENQIGKPVLENLASALVDPSYSPFVSRINPGSNAADLARVQALIARSTSPAIGLFPATAYGAIVDARNVNAAQVQVRGLDIDASYGFDVAQDHYDLEASATYLADYRRRLTPAAAAVQLLDRAGQPVDLRARFTANWTRGAYGATLGINYVDNYDTAGGEKIGAWATVDLQLRWSSTLNAGPLAGVTLAASAQNLFNTDPPFYDAPQGVGYDPANADPLGRFVSIQLTKRW